MAEELGVSRVALRERLLMLEALGVLERRQGSGTFVKPLDPDGLAFMLDLMLSSSHLTLGDLHTVRIALERQGAIQASLERNVDTRVMAECVHTMARARSKSAVTEADFLFHDQVLRIGNNPALTFFAGALHGVLHRSLEYRNERWRRSVADRQVLVAIHQEIIDAITKYDPERAAASVDQHFRTFDLLVEQPS